VVPVIYCYIDDLSNWFKRRFGSSAGTADRTAIPVAVGK
jgi:hypothetical protein